MTGLRRRVAIGFLSIVCLLFFSGMISLFELSHLSRDTGDILKANKRNIELAKRMLDAAHEQNVALIHLAVFGDRSYDSVCRNRMVIENLLVAQHQQLKTGLFSGLLKTPSFRRAQSEALDKSFLDSLAFATTEMRLLTDNFLASGDGTPFRTAFAPLVQADSAALASRWYQSDYETLYGRLTSAIKSYMTSTQSSLVPRAEQMKKNAYRAVTPVLISLAVMIAIVLMLYYFMSVYCVNPIVRMNKSLGDYLAFRTPFAAKAEFKDEVLGLREKIEALIALVKQSGKTQ